MPIDCSYYLVADMKTFGVCAAQSVIAVFFLVSLCGTGRVTAQTATTDPVGFIKFSPSPSTNGSTRKFTAASFPLQGAAKWTGLAAAEPGAATLTGSGAAWPNYGAGAGGFVTHVVRFKTGASTGRIFPIASNNATTLTLSLPTAVTNLGISVNQNDSFEIIPVNTLSSLFGSTAGTVKFNQNAVQNSADIVYLWNGSTWLAHWFDGNQWINQYDEFTDAGGTPIFSDEAAWIARRSTGTIDYYILGTVPVAASLALEIEGSTNSSRKFTFLSNPFPSDITLQAFNFTSLTNWQSNPVSNSADIAYIWNGSTWVSYWYDGTQWINQYDEFSDSGSTVIPSGSGIWVARRSSGSGELTFTNLTRPYSL